MVTRISVKFEQIPLFYPRGCAAPLRGIAAIATFGKVCCLLLVHRADYIRPRPRARPGEHGELLKLLTFLFNYNVRPMAGTVTARAWGPPSDHRHEGQVNIRSGTAQLRPVSLVHSSELSCAGMRWRADWLRYESQM